MKTVIIVQARMTSTRLPGKVLKTVLDKPLLEYQIERLRRIKLADEIVIAITTNDTDQPIVDFCNRLDLPFFRGSEEDVLSRYYGAAVEHSADVVVRVTSDCPVIDPVLSDGVIDFFFKPQNDYDYLRLFQYPRGLDTEVFTFKALEESYFEAKKQPEREHVTPFLYRHPERYKVKYMTPLEDYSHHRWTVDTPEDFELIKRIIEELYPVKKMFDFVDIIKVIQRNPEWYYINDGVRQKEYGE
ncbi:spore coat polysaccharide biosynthesis protein SpsF [Pelosinus fermentans]|uniref:cytidylyltransferase domain-containing protein n=1 Tax=Pelosinus fermentans TaxID=365349 RepID=UPI0002685EAC|nr:glycosyltransferase family protein [Pelosinus fermentans]OAM92855.1 acylneuraminate cytidylyltransferase [Pelosinus fermentans DSM 17108]SDQ59016.1 spore coat polysaccharide biosynthesis protein SpsF [Pelosinus fermentans]